MHLTNLASVAALVASVSAFASDPHVFNYNSTCDESAPKVRVFNRCPHKVFLWSVLKGQGCPSDDAVELGTGEFYQENFRDPSGAAGVSIKIAKESKCKDIDVTQLEYFIDSDPTYGANYLDVSFVDCPGEDCPGRDGYFLQSGNHDGMYTANAVNEICPKLSCDSVSECAKCSYILPDDRQTKSCNAKADLDFYMCGGYAPGDEPASPPSQQPSEQPSYVAPSSSSQPETSAAPEPSSSSAAYEEVAAAEVTPPPAPSAPKEPKIWTEVVYVTQVEYVNAKRHAHGHRHQHFRA
ncbi:hypothetical protein EJ04DRAFT_364104 [Polyplosphaeria fusca]|uniref:Uncharacterized protein n=1 Tax=Polyplosphaeria fusca TaxID=682080 RepID=A0A9P4QSI2_9PLEO|nr:hypothetical protein EJ04DRAFT_364104 [Polyplosphaeria fusca]